uniref:Small exported protein 2 n=1 Tax=Plasmodium berghei TaxID=5821 RepID=Q8MNY4_PLABE|nr:small exported protein 2 [Plasmodium berghei]
MKLAKALYFVAFLLAIKVLTPGSNNYVEAKPANSKKVTKSGDNAFIKKIKNNKAAFISTLAATVALAIATTFGVMHYQNNGGFEKSPWANKIDKNKSLPKKKTDNSPPSKGNLGNTSQKRNPISFTPISDGYKPSCSPNNNSKRTPTAHIL